MRVLGNFPIRGLAPFDCFCSGLGPAQCAHFRCPCDAQIASRVFLDPVLEPVQILWLKFSLTKEPQTAGNILSIHEHSPLSADAPT